MPRRGRVHALRRQFRRHPAIAALILAAALLLRVAVPSGFMPVVADGRLVIAICTGTGPATMAMPASAHASMPGMVHGSHDEGGTTKSPCAFADLSLPVLGAADPVLLAAALAFVAMLAVLGAVTLPPRAPTRLRPPLRGPPTTA